MKGHPITYSQEELAWLQANCELVIAEYHAEFLAAFGRDDVGIDNLKSLRTRRGWKTGRTGCFPKGNVPVNKGHKYPPGKGGRHPNAVRTQFAKGQRSGIAARIYKPIGTERLSKEGYLERKVHDGLPMQSRWQTVQRINWEAVNGPVPDGMILKCLDGDRLNVDPSNWALLSRGTLPYMNGHRGLNYETAEPEVRPAIIAVAKVRHAVRNARRATP